MRLPGSEKIRFITDICIMRVHNIYYEVIKKTLRLQRSLI